MLPKLNKIPSLAWVHPFFLFSIYHTRYINILLNYLVLKKSCIQETTQPLYLRCAERSTNKKKKIIIINLSSIYKRIFFKHYFLFTYIIKQKQKQTKKNIIQTLIPLTCADSRTNTKKIPKQTKTDRNGKKQQNRKKAKKKLTATDKNG